MAAKKYTVIGRNEMNGVWDRETDKHILPESTEWQAYLSWKAAGNVPENYPTTGELQVRAEAESKERMQVYGQGLTGGETELELKKLKKIKSLKGQMRTGLASEIGDYGDNITDTTRAIVLGEAIRIGLVSDQKIINDYGAYIQAMLTGYGGEGSIIGVLQADLAALKKYLVDQYYPAKGKVLAAADGKAVDSVSL